MFRKLFVIAFILTGFISVPSPVRAETREPDPSATLRKEIRIVKKDTRALKLRGYLARYASPLADYADTIILKSDRYGVPWSLVVSIAGVESTFCKQIPYQSSNCWGWNNGDHVFKDYDDALEIVTRTLRYNYIDKGLATPEAMARVYAPPSNVWGWKVRYFMNQINSQLNAVSTDIPITI